MVDCLFRAVIVIDPLVTFSGLFILIEVELSGFIPKMIMNQPYFNVQSSVIAKLELSEVGLVTIMFDIVTSLTRNLHFVIFAWFLLIVRVSLSNAISFLL